MSAKPPRKNKPKGDAPLTNFLHRAQTVCMYSSDSIKDAALNRTLKTQREVPPPFKSVSHQECPIWTLLITELFVSV